MGNERILHPCRVSDSVAERDAHAWMQCYVHSRGEIFPNGSPSTESSWLTFYGAELHPTFATARPSRELQPFARTCCGPRPVRWRA